MDEDFQSSLDHLLTELKRIELKLHLQVMRLRQEGRRSGEDRFRGLYISEDEIDTMVSPPPPWRGDSLPGLESPTIATLSESLEQLEADIAEKKRQSLSNGRLLRLDELERLFQLSTFDIEALLICILPELDLKYQRLYGYLQDDVTKKSPTVDLLLHLLGDSFEHRLAAREAFLPEAPLIRHHLLRLYDAHDPGKVPLPGKSLQADERITNYLLGTDQIDARLLPFARLLQPTVKLEDVILPDDTRHRLTKLATQFQEEGVIYYFRGGYGVGKQTTAEAICHQLETPMVCIDLNRMVAADIPIELSVQLIFREGLLQKAALYFSDSDLLFSDDREIKPGYDTMIAELESYPHWVFLAGEKYWEPRDVLHQRPFVNLEFPTPAYLARRQLWERQWNGQSPIPDDVDFSDLAGKFRLSGGQIRDTVATARNLALWRVPENGTMTGEDLYTACREQFGQRLSTLARKIHPRYDWDDIILPRDQTEQLLELCSYIKHRYTVSDDWGFGRKHSRGEGLNALFSGPSGTGKTMAAEIIANKLGLDLYRIDLSTIVSKYIGETEKNLDRVFREGQSSNAILFFDEADALFGKRSEVRDSHDRYANIEVAYLLQKMEEYDGMVILATNLRKNIDEAFARRLQFTVEFPHPDESNRYRIWQGMFPREAPVAKDTDFSFLARQFKITGGNIKNIALGAAFLAAEDGGCITMEKLIRATKREYQKIGKLCTEDDFAHYFELVKG
jgi:AAA+ superfamily predicted ATPase